MKKKVITLNLLLLLILSNLYGQNWDKIYNEIRKQQILVGKEKTHTNNYFNLRKKTSYLNTFSPITQKDTIFIIDFFVDYTSNSLCTIAWNKTDTIFCVSEDAGKTFKFEKNDFFTKYMMRLVSEWNINEIRKEESINHLLNYNTNFATRIIFNGKRCKIDYISFVDFFNSKRDGADFNH